MTSRSGPPRRYIQTLASIAELPLRLARPSLGRRLVGFVATAVLVLAGAAPGSAAPGGVAAGPDDARRPHRVRLERLDRGLVAATTPDGVYLSWRLLGKEVTGHTGTGMAGPDFHVYRDGRRIATVTDSTNYLDAGAPAGASYRVAAVVRGREVDRSRPVSPWSGAYYDLPLRRPPDGVTPAGEAYTYSANDMSVGDVDGDGQYEFIVKWDPSNSKDVSQVGYTGTVFIDAYEFDGRLLYRIDLGVNIRAGAHYTQFLVYDFDGDGRAEMMFKTAPATWCRRASSPCRGPTCGPASRTATTTG